jgi:hypothetical protein
MGLIKDQRIIESLTANPNIKAFRILTTNKIFEKRFKGNISYFFKTLKNGLNSFQSISNRQFFKNLSGCYFSLQSNENIEIIILYDESITKLNRLQVNTRIKKLLGIEIEIEFGDFETYRFRINEMIGINRKTQAFGNFYFQKEK